MPFYEVTVVGTGIRVPVEDREAVGFFRLIRVSAADPTDAEAKAVPRLHADWQSTVHAQLNQGVAPTVLVEKACTLPWWYRFLPARRGYIFFENDSEV
jgi:hypothetical protein